ncbi:flavin-containing monooxygenase [Cryobacterium serini]|uniref:NAD(P)/FAD-dependent oxidoreductase n=1 Tax=Cryobacterium serini TaxID=1259201 RepID=A0A4R9BI72_9MICO|nr:NAD(P)/FAD-dependent oxidoreductase [Cryobacterium serini]TFD85183.1 NAD(P)/FAD-dependent oxidoreductase [Cryobacterium serini]
MSIQTTDHDVVILGAGFGGLGMGAQLKEAGIENFAIFDKGPGLGGVWRENSYPGAACDTEAHLYCYSFFPHLRVSRMYADRNELMGYLERLATRYTLGPHLNFNTEVTSAVWDGANALWRLQVNGSGEHTARVFIPAWGQLNTPFVPAFPGLADFQGAAFHSARWDHTVDLTGKKIISIGSAASAVQYVPEVAKVAGSLEVFQRSANWIMPRNQVIFSKEQLDSFEENPDTFEQSRRNLHDFRENGFERTRRATDAQRAGVAQAVAHLEAQVPDPELRRKLTPDYEFGCKRILRTDDYYPALMGGNVELVTQGIDAIVPEGIRTRDGQIHKADVIIFGTGFSSQAFQGDLQVIGASGEDLKERWADGAEAHLGMSVDGFPNMFMIYGPNTNLNHNSIITMLEIQQAYILKILVHLLTAPQASVEVRGRVLTSYNASLQNEMEGSAFSADCSSWYKNAAGKVINNWSGTVEEYRSLAGHWNPGDYMLSGAVLPVQEMARV